MTKALDILRNRKTGTAKFRHAARRVANELARTLRSHLLEEKMPMRNIVVVIILRSAIALLDAAMDAFPDAPVGVVGLRRSPRTLQPYWYYENLPKISKKSIIVLLDPMLATGGSAEAAVRRLVGRGASNERIYFAGVVASRKGLARLARVIPKENILLASLDRGLDKKGMIVPGVGDFGDRYFGYADLLPSNIEHLEWLEQEKKRKEKLQRIFHPAKKQPPEEDDRWRKREGVSEKSIREWRKSMRG